MIVCPHTKLHPETRAALPGALFVRIKHKDHYRELLGELWEIGKSFTLVEHDVVPRPEQLAALEACDQPWCLYSYGAGFWIPTFGCVRLSAELIAATPHLWDEPAWLWNQLDQEFRVQAFQVGFRPHWHWPHVRHAPRGLRWEPSVEEQVAQLENELRLLRFSVERKELARAS